jgi:epoxyqueuosine reductase
MSVNPADYSTDNFHLVAEKIKQWGKALGFNKVGITDIDLTDHEDYLQEWLDKQYHGEMAYMARHGMKRARPAEIHPGTIRVISVRMDYLAKDAKFASTLHDNRKAYISRYALGRDYHKVLRQRLKQLGEKIKTCLPELDYRPFVDSAPVLERPLAAKAGLGWVGKHSLLLDESAGSWFFIGELMVNIPLPVDEAVEDQCGSCSSCIKICPTGAIVAPYVVDSRRCISYLTIELKDSIPEQLRPLMGNRIYGCDDCQLVCPWNQYANLSAESDFETRNNLNDVELLELFSWDEATFQQKMAGSAIYRIGYEQWQRNIVVALGNADYSDDIVAALEAKLDSSSEMVIEHIHWAIEQHQRRSSTSTVTNKLVRTIQKISPRDA